MWGDKANPWRRFQEPGRSRLQILGPRHPDTLATRANIARWTGEATQAGRTQLVLSNLRLTSLPADLRRFTCLRKLNAAAHRSLACDADT
jgi:hypothetical protein